MQEILPLLPGQDQFNVKELRLHNPESPPSLSNFLNCTLLPKSESRLSPALQSQQANVLHLVITQNDSY
ncbi:hypothetical protein Q8A67_022826 [Cirrhinus molitorella]|uniref:Uncharacterized protein n=1 Tax=Cirrhinus molitorella TaxID=172907 RepID=A0AA88TFM4_9TELE|nr:hypothetical protein Q8A67_022826 [Cirrhinus molitorella]